MSTEPQIWPQNRTLYGRGLSPSLAPFQWPPARFRFPSPQLPLALIPLSLFLPTDERDLCGGERHNPTIFRTKEKMY